MAGPLMDSRRIGTVLTLVNCEKNLLGFPVMRHGLEHQDNLLLCLPEITETHENTDSVHLVLGGVGRIKLG